LIVAAAASECCEGDRGDGGLGRNSPVLIEILRGRVESGEADIEGVLEFGLEVGRGVIEVDVGREFRSGGMSN
jgi:hypothetical protein